MTDNTEIILAYAQGKRKGTVLLKKDYNLLSNLIIDSFGESSEITFAELISKVNDYDFSYPKEKALWLLLKVKQDLEFRGVLKNKFIGRSQNLRINRKVLKTQSIYFRPV